MEKYYNPNTWLEEAYIPWDPKNDISIKEDSAKIIEIFKSREKIHNLMGIVEDSIQTKDRSKLERTILNEYIWLEEDEEANYILWKFYLISWNAKKWVYYIKKSLSIWDKGEKELRSMVDNIILNFVKEWEDLSKDKDMMIVIKWFKDIIKWVAQEEYKKSRWIEKGRIWNFLRLLDK